MTGGYWGGGPFGEDPFEEFLSQFFGSRQGQQGRRIDLARLMSQDARELIQSAAQIATEWGSQDLDTEHLLWAICQREPLRQLIARAGADPGTLATEIEERARRGEPRREPPTLTPAAKRALLQAHQISRTLGSSYLGPEHILLALVVNRDSEAGRTLSARGVTPDSLRQAAQSQAQGTAAQPSAPTATPTPTVDRYGRDLTALARDGKIDPVVGRMQEIEQCVEVLARRTKNNPVLIGEAGVGKTAIVEGLAQRMVDGEVPRTLAGKRLVQIDLTGLVAGTRYRGDFEERLKNLIDEIRANTEDLIVFIDEIHSVAGAGSAEGATDASNILKPALSRGELHVVGATTLDEYRRYVEKDAALERRFQPILVPEPNVEDTVEILRGLRDRYEAHHGVRFNDEALVSAAELSDRYLTDRFLPDKAIDLIDQAGARVQLRSRAPATDVRDMERRIEQLCHDKDQAVANEQYERASQIRDEVTELRRQMTEADGGPNGVSEVTADDIAEVVSRATGIPAQQLSEEERHRLANLEQRLHERLIGQADAVEVVSQAIRRSRTGLGDPNRPIGSFLFLGPTGVGKTELARALAEAMFGDQDRMVRLDMSEFQERHTVSRLVGAPPGYVGYEEAGQLTEAVRRRPYSVILLDEIEKAHPDVFNLLLQVLDDGRLTDSQGRTVSFKNTVLIMTSNLGSEMITQEQGLGFASEQRTDQDARDRVMRRLREELRPEFLNRIDEIVVFQRLTAEQLAEITDLMLEQTRRRMHAQDINVHFTRPAIGWLVDRGYEPQYGARPMRRTIQREVDNRLSEMMLDGRLSHGQEVRVDVSEEEKLTFEITPRLAEAPAR
ncbi:ATP-dependent Clp protease ATP-binding subunit [Phytohabitans flavus]|uniref:ATP-dependent Clp protease ATP-binding subunit n=1 Tax=Phytohabitans flavus TaxID=1076124 RepID=UPI0031F18152